MKFITLFNGRKNPQIFSQSNYITYLHAFFWRIYRTIPRIHEDLGKSHLNFSVTAGPFVTDWSTNFYYSSVCRFSFLGKFKTQ